MGDPERMKAPWRLLEGDQVALYLLSILAVAACAWAYAAARWPHTRPVERLKGGERIEYRVDLNRAGAQELDLLPGLGPAKAARIIAYREAHGPFQRGTDLLKVPGLSADTVARLRGLVTPDVDAALQPTELVP